MRTTETDIPAEYEAELRRRIHEQISCEAQGDVVALYEFILPTIRAERIAEGDDEPSLSLGEIQEFVGWVRSAVVESIEVERFHSSVDRFSGSPAAIVVSRVRYNEATISEFRTIWVRDDGTWFSTALWKSELAGDQ